MLTRMMVLRDRDAQSSCSPGTSGARVAEARRVVRVDVERDEPEIADRGGSRDRVHFREGAD
jgi:hypothetical protein